MSRSHLSARHFLKQIDSDRSRRKRRDIRPPWLTALVAYAAELFEPLADTGRVGFDCRLDDKGWSVELYLGSIELVGGKDDGQVHDLAFRFDLQPLLERFTRVDGLSWHIVPPGADADDPRPRSFLLIDGNVAESRVRFGIHAVPPRTVGPGLRRLPDGRMELT